LLSAASASDGGSYNAPEPANPNTKIKIRIPLDKEMDVVRHQNIAPNRNIMIVRSSTVVEECIVNSL